MEKYTLGAYWGDRPEGLDACTDRIYYLIKELSKISDLFRHWSRGGDSYEEAIKDNITVTREDLKEYLAKEGRTRTDFGNQIMEDLGFSFGAWNKKKNPDSMSLSISCGMHTGIPGLINSCVINLPSKETTSPEILKYSTLMSILKIVIKAVEPDWATISTYSLYKEIMKTPARTPRTGWFMYLSKWRGHIPKLPDPCFTEEVENYGTIIALTTEWFDINNKEHIKLANKVHKILSKNKLLKPTPQTMKT